MDAPRNKNAYPKGRQVDRESRAEVRSLIGDMPRNRDLLIEFLHLIQDGYGHLSARHLAALAQEMKLSQAEIYETASFYHHFDIVKEGETEPAEITVRVCDGIACEMAGAKRLYSELSDEIGTTARVVKVPCVGGCFAAPVAVIGKKQVHEADVSTVAKALSDGDTTPGLPDAEPLNEYRAAGGYAALEKLKNGGLGGADLIDELEAADLRGMGGAGFPTARKWRFLEGTAKPRVLAVNADEGEPGTFKDRYCFETEPHKVLDGALIAAAVIEAEDIYIYLRDEYPHIHALLEREIEAVTKEGLADGVRIHLRRGAGAYICGEESGMLESIEGKRGLPRNRPPYPAQSGLFGRPTLINNVETLYWVADIARNGSQWYLDEGRPHLFSVSGRVKRPGVVKAPSGVTVRQLIDEHCGGMAEGHMFKAYLPGGASGGILPASKDDLPLDFGVLEEFGCFVGSAAVVIFSEQDQIRDVVLNLLRFFADESCGQCTPCRVGCEKMVKLLEQDRWDQPLMDDLSLAMREASICGLGQAAPNPVQSAFRFFEGEIE